MANIRSQIDLDINYDELVTETEAAWLLSIDGREVWLPKSQCRIYEKTKVIYVPEWLATERDLV